LSEFHVSLLDAEPSRYGVAGQGSASAAHQVDARPLGPITDELRLLVSFVLSFPDSEIVFRRSTVELGVMR